MPTYEYECSACRHRFERFQKITDPPVRQCPKCKARIRRLPGAGAGILFKGTGFYQTDYRSPSYKTAAAKEKGEASGTQSSAGERVGDSTALKKAAE